MFSLLLLDQEHCVLEHWVEEQALLVKLWLNELSKKKFIGYIFHQRKNRFTGICFGRGGGASRMTRGAWSRGGGG